MISKEFRNNVSDDYSILKKCDIIFACLPTPLDNNGIPDISILEKASEQIFNNILDNTIIVFESTVAPNTINYLEEKYYLNTMNSKKEHVTIVYSPERISPNEMTITDNPKLIASKDMHSIEVIEGIYQELGVSTVKVSSIKVAEYSKLLENIQRDINISFMNEFSRICRNDNIDFNDVLNAASTKKNFVRYNVGLIGGHCIGTDTEYLINYVKENNICDEKNINFMLSSRYARNNMIYNISNDIKALCSKYTIDKIYILGMTYKEDVPDIRESGSIKLLYNLEKELPSVTIIPHDYYIEKFDTELTYDSNTVYIIAKNHKKYKNFYDSILEHPKEKSNFYIYDISGSMKNYFSNIESQYYSYGYKKI